MYSGAIQVLLCCICMYQGKVCYFLSCHTGGDEASQMVVLCWALTTELYKMKQKIKQIIVEPVWSTAAPQNPFELDLTKYSHLLLGRQLCLSKCIKSDLVTRQQKTLQGTCWIYYFSLNGKNVVMWKFWPCWVCPGGVLHHCSFKHGDTAEIRLWYHFYWSGTVRRHGHVTQWKSRSNFTSSAGSIFQCTTCVATDAFN